MRWDKGQDGGKGEIEDSAHPEWEVSAVWMVRSPRTVVCVGDCNSEPVLKVSRNEGTGPGLVSGPAWSFGLECSGERRRREAAAGSQEGPLSRPSGLREPTPERAAWEAGATERGLWSALEGAGAGGHETFSKESRWCGLTRTAGVGLQGSQGCW